MKNQKKSGKIFCDAFLFYVQKVNHNYDLYPKFEQKNFKNEDRNLNSVTQGNMAGNKRRKKQTKQKNT